jgi:hypothetical protein
MKILRNDMKNQCIKKGPLKKLKQISQLKITYIKKRKILRNNMKN